MLGLESAGPGLSRPVPDRRHPHALELSRRALVLVRSAVSSAINRRCCTGRRTTCGGSISSSGRDADPEEEKKPERILPRLRAMLGENAASRSNGRACTRSSAGACARSATAACCSRAMPRTGLAVRRARREQRHPGRRQSGVEARAGARRAGAAERCSTATTPSAPFAADENIRNSTRSTDFITPKSDVSRSFRDAALMLAKRHAFARKLVNSGRLVAAGDALRDSPLNTPDTEAVRGPDAARRARRRCAGRRVRAASGFSTISSTGSRCWYSAGRTRSDCCGSLPRSRSDAIPCNSVLVDAARSRFAGRRDRALRIPTACSPSATTPDPGTCYLFRPDQHVCARWRAFDRRAGACRDRARHDRRRHPCTEAIAHAQDRTQHRGTRRFLRGADRPASRADRRAERARQCQADPAARQPHRRHGGAARGDRGGAGGRGCEPQQQPHVSEHR